jgi:hypothetical protein
VAPARPVIGRDDKGLVSFCVICRFIGSKRRNAVPNVSSSIAIMMYHGADYTAADADITAAIRRRSVLYWAPCVRCIAARRTIQHKIYAVNQLTDNFSNFIHGFVTMLPTKADAACSNFRVLLEI